MLYEKEPLELDSRKKIYSIVEKAPGLHFREIQRRANIAIGALQYHLDVLEKFHLIKKDKKGKFARYYSIRKPFTNEEEKIMGLLRQEAVRRIMLFVLSRKRAPSNNALIAALGLSPSTCTFHLKKLEESGLLERKKRGKRTLIYLKEPQKIAKLLVLYRKTFFDELVDNFADTFEQISEQ